jgi:hypothetical protein
MDLLHGDIHDLDAASLDKLVRLGEPAHVERKAQIPTRERLAAAISGMANASGGWLVIGVDDHGSTPGLQLGRTDLAAHIRQLIAPAVDPVPNFNARLLPYVGVEIGVVRVYASAETPHLTQDGRIVVREPGGIRPVSHRSELDALIARGIGRAEDATARLPSQGLADILEAPELAGADAFERPVHREWILRASPLGLDDGFGRRATSDGAVSAARRIVETLMPAVHGEPSDEWTDVITRPPGWLARRTRLGDAAAASLAVDPAGVVAGLVRERGVRSVINIRPLVGETIVPLLGAATTLLAELGAAGRVVCDLHARGFDDVVIQQVPHHVALDGRTYSSRQQHILSAADDVADLGEAAMELALDLARGAGLPVFG